MSGVREQERITVSQVDYGLCLLLSSLQFPQRKTEWFGVDCTTSAEGDLKFLRGGEYG
ncbi:MAG: hypothetical protein JW878_04810 [Methanomicrobia archaeon]|nr:hypothetical protein [Methanomicrobia archaeon]